MIYIQQSHRAVLLHTTFASLLALFILYMPFNAGAYVPKDEETLSELNQSYLVSYRTGNTQWFSDNLSEDFREVAPDGTMLNKTEFLRKIEGRAGGDPQAVRAAELEIRFSDNLAIVTAIPEVVTQDGKSLRGGRYTDVYHRVGDRWLCITAHLGGN